MTVPQPVGYAIAACFVIGVVTTVTVVAVGAMIATGAYSTGRRLSPQQVRRPAA
ncbi:hypothetical protein L6241_10310 [Janibacter sp. Y6]|uniref:hypothetical protein n=1 Tax=Janibacter sp. Y6 TaxID=2913552 RepID=UPI0034A48304